MNDAERINSYNLRRATKRLNREINIIAKDPIPGIDLRANEDNILEWHFVIHGKEDTPYYGGMYHGKLIFPSNFPFGPPKILFLTPNGRFKTNERICFSLSDFHPEEWKPAFSVTTVLQGITDFMHENTETIGSIETSESVKRQLAENSSIHNGKDGIFCKLFPKLCGRKVTDSEDSSGESSTISPVREKTPLPDEISLPPRIQSPTSTEIPLPPTNLIPVLIEITPTVETVMSEEILLMLKETVVSREESSSPREIIKSSGEESRIPSETIQGQRTTTPPTLIAPSVTMPIHDSERYPGAPIPPTSSGPKHLETNSQIPEKNDLEERPADNPAENRSLPSPPIQKSPDATDSQKKLSSPKERIHRRTPSPESKVSVREKTPSPDDNTLLPRTQSPTSTGITQPPAHLTPPFRPGETEKREETLLKSKEIVFSRGESSSPLGTVQTFRNASPIPSKSIQEQRAITPPTHTTPPGTHRSFSDLSIFSPAICPEAQPSSRGEKPSTQNVYQRTSNISPINPKQRKSETNSQPLESIGLEERRAHYFGEYRKLPSPPIRSPGATDSQRNLPSLPKEKIPQQAPSPQREISLDVERGCPSTDFITPVGSEILDRQEVNTHSLLLHRFQRNIKRMMDFTTCALVAGIILILILGLLLIALLFILT